MAGKAVESAEAVNLTANGEEEGIRQKLKLFCFRHIQKAGDFEFYSRPARAAANLPPPRAPWQFPYAGTAGAQKSRRHG
jgi:hypothetical protein